MSSSQEALSGSSGATNWGDLASGVRLADVAVDHKHFRGRAAHERLRKKIADEIGTNYENIEAAYKSLIAQADLQAFDARKRTVWWSRTYYVLGLPAAILAGVSGAAGLSSANARILAGVVALVSAGLTAAVTFLNSEDRRKTNDALAAGWQNLAEQARVDLMRHRNKDDVESQQALLDLMKLNRSRNSLARGIPPRDDDPVATLSPVTTIVRTETPDTTITTSQRGTWDEDEDVAGPRK